jgi:hypothetical protein
MFEFEQGKAEESVLRLAGSTVEEWAGQLGGERYSLAATF